MKIYPFTMIVLLLIGCNEKDLNTTEVKPHSLIENVNREIIVFDEDYEMVELKTYKDDGSLNSSVLYNENGEINYDRSFYMNLHPKTDLLNLFIDKFIYLDFHDGRGIDSLNLFVKYLDQNNQILYIDSIDLKSNINGFLYPIEELQTIPHSLKFELEPWSYASNSPNTLIGGSIEKIKWITYEETIEPKKNIKQNRDRF